MVGAPKADTRRRPRARFARSPGLLRERGRVLRQRLLHARQELVLVREGQARVEVAEEELVGRVPCADDPLPHGQRLGDGGAQDLALAGVDEHLEGGVTWRGVV